MNVFGSAEYPRTRLSKNELERQVVVDLFTSDTEVVINYDLVYEDGSDVLASDKMSADDNSIIAPECTDFRIPYNYCAGKNYGFIRSPYRPPCADNNYSLNSLAGCIDPVTGAKKQKCVAIAYTQNTFIPRCKINDPECGTFLEIHQRHGTPYSSEEDVISEVRLDQYNVSGAYTTTIDLTWMRNSSRILCAYSEQFLRVGAVVYIKPESPQCCCPFQYDFTGNRDYLGFVKPTYFGSFFCPWGPSGGSGPTATYDASVYDALDVDHNVIAYPFCHTSQELRTDILMCSVQDPPSGRFYTRPCITVNYSTAVGQDLALFGPVKGYTSIDLSGRGYFPPMAAAGGVLETG